MTVNSSLSLLAFPHTAPLFHGSPARPLDHSISTSRESGGLGEGEEQPGRAQRDLGHPHLPAGIHGAR